MPKDIKGNTIVKGDNLVCVQQLLWDPVATVLLYKCLDREDALKEKASLLGKGTFYVKLEGIVEIGAIKEKSVQVGWVGRMGSGGQWLKIPTNLCKPDVNNRNILMWLRLEGYNVRNTHKELV